MVFHFKLGSGSTAAEKKQEAIPADSFLEALDSLSRSKIEVLEHGIEKAREQFKLVMKQVQNFINLSSIVNAGQFLYAVIEDGTPDSKQFSRPNCLLLLAQFALRGHIAKSPSRKNQNLPLIGMRMGSSKKYGSLKS